MRMVLRLAAGGAVAGVRSVSAQPVAGEDALEQRMNSNFTERWP